MTKPLGAPACFAAASIFSRDSNVCKACLAFVDCGSASLETLQSIKHLINVEDLLKRHAAAHKAAQAAIEAADATREETLPPGNGETPIVVKPVERKTTVVKIRFEPTSDEEQIVARLPVKPRELALRMVRANDVAGIREALKEGRNYYAERGPAFMRVVMTMLLTGGFTKRSLRLQLESEFAWTEGTAASHVGIACAILAGFKLAEETKGHFALSPASGA